VAHGLFCETLASSRAPSRPPSTMKSSQIRHLYCDERGISAYTVHRDCPFRLISHHLFPISLSLLTSLLNQEHPEPHSHSPPTHLNFVSAQSRPNRSEHDPKDILTSLPKYAAFAISQNSPTSTTPVNIFISCKSYPAISSTLLQFTTAHLGRISHHFFWEWRIDDKHSVIADHWTGFHLSHSE
jgi:hypothetical protein